jgi:hypothetical protein
MTNSKYPSTDFPVERLWDLFDFNPLSGFLISRKGPNKGKPIMGTLSENKRRWIIRLTREYGKQQLTNYGRAVFAWVHGRWPEGSIDHINREIRDNRSWNLREADIVLQTQNTRSFNYGAYWDKRERKWRTRIYINAKRKYLGLYDTVKEAQEAFMRFSNEIGRPYLDPVLVDGRYIPAERLQ